LAPGERHFEYRLIVGLTSAWPGLGELIGNTTLYLQVESR
jgi:hypothetical protein